MLEDALLDLSNRGDLVIDPFLGSGSTLIAADKTGVFVAASSSTRSNRAALRRDDGQIWGSHRDRRAVRGGSSPPGNGEGARLVRFRRQADISDRAVNVAI